ncbi:MAG: ABC transporter ATP-binding protein, partial [Actinomycetota bacterium]|nr:ABC transporter ATP-binding protein [Actinomycetota bacterium]
MSQMLPVADTSSVRRYAVSIFRRHPRWVAGALGLHLLAAVAGLAGPKLLGDLVQGVTTGTTLSHVNHVAIVLACFL